MQTKAEVLRHFDRMADGGRWAGLYDQQGDAVENYSFIARRRRVEELLGPVLRDGAEVRRTDGAGTDVNGGGRAGVAVIGGDGAGPGVRLLDVGCGSGVMGPFVLSRGGRYHGIDLSEKMIADAAARFARSDLDSGRVRLEVGDVEDIRHADGAFDATMALGVFEYMPGAERAADELTRVTRIGGTIIVSVPNAWCVDAVTSAMLSPIVTPATQIAKRLLGRGGKPTGFRHHKFRPAALDAMFQRRGCIKTGGAFYNVELAFYPLRRLAPMLSLRLKRRGESAADGAAAAFATAYIGRYQRISSRGNSMNATGT